LYKYKIIENASVIFWAAVITAFIFYAKWQDDKHKEQQPNNQQFEECLNDCTFLKN